ncbi:hypothetical protein [Chitinophaga sp. HK235]|uniref:hypothetical protein n=1 Tax=Chitinophaga sp. HK235 TaxID=2952571 RepID=UPI001BA5C925|nr:hypothetical protein [Chitinophaga sp. HK235]
MKKIRVVLASIGAVIGIGGAYASSHYSVKSPHGLTVFNWYTANGTFVLVGNTVTARTLACPITGVRTCLIGTVGGVTYVTAKLRKL